VNKLTVNRTSAGDKGLPQGWRDIGAMDSSQLSASGIQRPFKT